MTKKIEIFKRLKTNKYLLKFTDLDKRNFPTTKYSSIEWRTLSEARNHGKMLKSSLEFIPEGECFEFVEEI